MHGIPWQVDVFFWLLLHPYVPLLAIIGVVAGVVWWWKRRK